MQTRKAVSPSGRPDGLAVVIKRRLSSIRGLPAPGRNQRGSLVRKSESRAAAFTHAAGFTLLELIIVITILSVLTAAAVPMVRNTVKREREAELRVALRQIRSALDRYKKYNDDSLGASIPIEYKTQSGFPKDLKILEEGFIPANVVGTTGTKVRFLRKVPIDPMTGKADWALRAFKDEANATSWGGEDVWDVYSKSTGEALNGTKYRDW